MRSASLALVVPPLLLLLGGCAGKAINKAIEEGGKKLSAAELTTLVAGNTLKMAEYGVSAKVECFPNGKLYAINSEQVESAGSWQVDGQDRLCLRFKRLGGSESFCGVVYQVGDEYREFTDNGALSGSFTVIPGTSRTPPGSSKPPGTSSSPTLPASVSRQAAAPAASSSPPALAPPPLVEHHADTDIRFFYLQMAQNCPGCNLAAVDLAGASLMGANLPGADLRKANLSKANLQQANLRGANLTSANLRDANLAGANLAGANLTGADLTNADLTRTTLSGAVLEGAVGAKLDNVIR